MSSGPDVQREQVLPVTPETFIVRWQCRSGTKLLHKFWLQNLITKLVCW